MNKKTPKQYTIVICDYDLKMIKEEMKKNGQKCAIMQVEEISEDQVTLHI